MSTQPSGVTNSAFLINDETNPPAYSAIFPFKIDESEGNKCDAKRSNILPSYSTLANEQNSFGTTSFSMYSQSPISYNELFNHQGSTLANNLSSRFLFQQSNDDMPPSPIILEQLQRAEELNENSLRKQIETIFPKSYLLRHSIFIVASSLTLICFQIILMNNNGILSYLGSGIWAGLFNLFTLFVSVITCKYNIFARN
jgi:hypothetical protein